MFGKRRRSSSGVQDILDRQIARSQRRKTQFFATTGNDFPGPRQQPGFAAFQHFKQGRCFRNKNPSKCLVVLDDIAAIVDQVRQLDGLGLTACVRQMLPVYRFTNGPVSVGRPADIGEFVDHDRDCRAELRFDIFVGRRSILQRIVQPGTGYRLGVVADRGDDIGNRFQVGVVGLVGVLAPLIDTAMGLGREFLGAFDEILHVSSPVGFPATTAMASGKRHSTGIAERFVIARVGSFATETPPGVWRKHRQALKVRIHSTGDGYESMP